MFNLSQPPVASSSAFEPLEPRLCLSAGTSSAAPAAPATLSAHELHVRHLAHLQQLDKTTTIGNTLSPHQQHLRHLRQLAATNPTATAASTAAPASTGGTLSAHQRHLRHLRALAAADAVAGAIADTTTTGTTTGAATTAPADAGLLDIGVDTGTGMIDTGDGTIVGTGVLGNTAATGATGVIDGLLPPPDGSFLTPIGGTTAPATDLTGGVATPIGVSPFPFIVGGMGVSGPLFSTTPI
jgi:hypothetical protein